MNHYTHPQETTMRHQSMPRLLAATATLTLVLAAAPSKAASFDFDGNIVMNTDLVNVDFTVSPSAGMVALWTDSFRSGLNFDPELTLWQRVGASYVLVATNDDDSLVNPAQGYQDAGLTATLAAGAYKLTLSASSYQPVGIMFSQGYQFDPFFIPAIAPTPIASWNQPSYDPDLDNQKGTFWSVHLTGANVLSATVSPVPEPASIVLMFTGLVALGLARVARRG